MSKYKQPKSYSPLAFSNHKPAILYRKAVYQLIEKHGEDQLLSALFWPLFLLCNSNFRIYAAAAKGTSSNKDLIVYAKLVGRLRWAFNDVLKGKKCTFDELTDPDYVLIINLSELLRDSAFKILDNYKLKEHKVLIEIIDAFQECNDKLRK